MARYSLTSMIFASAMLAAPALAATTSTGPGANPGASSPGAAAPATPPGSAPGANHAAGPATAAHPTAAANQPAPPKFTTADNQLRAGKLVGATVYNDKDQSVGSIDDILLSQDQKAQTAVISVGGFLGMGSKLVSVPFDKLKIEKDKVVMPGATQDALKKMPEYKFNSNA